MAKASQMQLPASLIAIRIVLIAALHSRTLKHSVSSYFTSLALSEILRLEILFLLEVKWWPLVGKSGAGSQAPLALWCVKRATSWRKELAIESNRLLHYTVLTIHLLRSKLALKAPGAFNEYPHSSNASLSASIRSRKRTECSLHTNAHSSASCQAANIQQLIQQQAFGSKGPTEGS